MRGQASLLRHTPSRRHNSGFTLVELIISIVLIGLLAAVGSSMIADSFTTTRMVNAGTASAGQARYALERLAREIREIKFSSDVTGNYCITTMTETTLVLKKSTTGSLTACDTPEVNTITVTITWDTPNLTLGYSSPAATSSLSGQVTSFSLTYFQNDGTTAATSNSAIRFVVINMTVTDSTSGQSISQRTRVALRNA